MNEWGKTPTKQDKINEHKTQIEKNIMKNSYLSQWKIHNINNFKYIFYLKL